MTRVHIVCKEPNPEKIIARLAQTLAAQTGWSISSQPRRDVDLNYFFPYLDVEIVPTLSAAWFTHQDPTHPEKVRRWNEAAARVDLRLTSARLYLEGLASFGPSALVTPPIDPAFRPLPPRYPLPGAPRVGVSGFSYGDGRKGEDLIKRLVKDLPNAAWSLIGRGWGGKTQHMPQERLYQWVQSLGLYVCASRLEGVPMPPLEALACGVPIVIPRGVGLLDDIPDIPGVWRFEAGNYDDLRQTVERAIGVLSTTPMGSGGVDGLVDAVAHYTPEQWAADHVQAFQDLVDPPLTEPLPDWQGNAGVYVVAFGAPARACAERLLASCARYMPDVPTLLVSTEPLGIETYFQKQADYDIGGRLAKLSIDRNAPPDWHYILYLDADTELIAPVPHFFEVLQAGWELTICTNPGKYHTTKLMVRPDNKDEVQRTYDVMGHDDLLQFNGGVFAFRRSPRTHQFFERWIAEWMQEAKRDQAALLRALWTVPLRVYTLTNVWNSMNNYNDPADSAGILHHQQEARRVSGIVPERGDSPEAFKKVIR